MITFNKAVIPDPQGKEGTVEVAELLVEKRALALLQDAVAIARAVADGNFDHILEELQMDLRDAFESVEAPFVGGPDDWSDYEQNTSD